MGCNNSNCGCNSKECNKTVVRETGLRGPAGATGAQGSTGPQGIPGLNFIQVVGVPSNLVGVDGESAIDNLTGDLYLKTAGTWIKTGNFGSYTPI